MKIKIILECEAELENNDSLTKYCENLIVYFQGHPTTKIESKIKLIAVIEE